MQATLATPPVPSSESLARDLLAVMLHIYRDSGPHFYALVEELELSLTQIKTLHALELREPEASVKELAHLLGLSLPAASRNVESLLQRGYLERREDEHDRRIKRVRLTKLGREVSMALHGARLASLREFVATLSERERRRLCGALASLISREDIAACRPNGAQA